VERVRQKREAGKAQPSRPGVWGLQFLLHRPQSGVSGEEAQLGALVHSFFIRGGVSIATCMFLAGGKTVIFFSMQNVQSLPILQGEEVVGRSQHAVKMRRRNY
jgi:hypothetical protein